MHDKVKKELGYTKVPGQYSHGRAIFENKQASRSLRFISADWDVHSVGVWKGAATIKDLATKTNRTGTFDSLLRYLKE